MPENQDSDASPRGPQHPDHATWQAVLDVVPGYLAIADRDRRIQLVNRLPLGMPAAQYIGRDFADLVGENQRASAIHAAEEVLAGAPLDEREGRSARTNRWFRSRMAGILDDDGAVTGFVVHLLDVDEAARNRAALARLRARDPRGMDTLDAGPGLRRLELMLDHLPYLIAYVDKDLRYRYNNMAYEAWFGIPREQMRGRHISEVLGDAYDLVVPNVDEALQGHRIEREFDLPYRGGTLRRVVAHLIPDLSVDGAVEGFCVWVQDLTERRRAETALRQREDELRQAQKMEALGRLAAGIAHDFNNLLQTVISGCSALLMDLGDREPRATEQIGRIRRAAQGSATLTRHLLAFGRPAEVPAAALAVDDLLADMGFLLERLLGASYRLQVDAASGCQVFAEAGEIQQVLMNLVINARDAMPEGGTLMLEARQVDVSEEEARAHVGLRPGPYARLVVADTGSGMDPQTQARMFDPFFTTKGPDQGTGLGLASVYGIVRRLGGHIDVESAPGAGTTFRIYLPCH